MSDFVNQTPSINYISQKKKICVGRSNEPIQDLITFDYRITDTFSFQIINAINQLVNLNYSSYQIYGSIIDAKKEMHVIFYTNSYSVINNVLTFTIDTYTNEYLELIKNNDTPIDLTIIGYRGNNSSVILRDRALANPRPYIDGREPLLIVYNKVLDTTIPVSGQFGAGTDLDLVFGTPSFAFGEGLITNDTNQIVLGQYNVTDATKVLIVGGGSGDANRSNIFTIDETGNVEANTLSATKLYVGGEEFTPSAFIDSLSTTYETIEDATEKYNVLTGQIEDIHVPLSTSELINDSDFTTSAVVSAIASAYAEAASGTQYKAGNGLALSSDQQTFYLTASIPTSTSQLTNNSEFATSSYVQSASGNAVNVATGWVNGKNYLSSITFEGYNNFQDESISIPATGVYVDQYSKIQIGQSSENQVSLDWKGVGIEGGAEGVEFDAHWIYFDDKFSIINNEDGASISLSLSTSQLTNDSGYTTSAVVSAIASAYADAASGTEYKAGEGLALSSDNETFYLTASIPNDSDISGIASAVASTYVENNVPTKVSELQNDTGFITLASVPITNISGGVGIKITQIGQTALISIASAVITATSASITFDKDFMGADATSSVLYTSYNGLATPTVSFSGTLPQGITTGTVPSGISFTAIKSAIGEQDSTVYGYITFDAPDAYSPVTNQVEIKTINFTREEEKPLTFKATADNQSVTLSAIGSPNTNNFAYNKNNTGWYSYSVGTTIELNQGDTVSFSGNTQVLSKDSSNYYKFVTVGPLIASGNVMSLVNWATLLEADNTDTFTNLFRESTITRPPVLPAETLSQRCYYSMFRECPNLTATPILPVTDVSECDSCYENMFANCSSLVSASPISAATFDMADRAMCKMFSGCINLVEMPDMNPLSGMGGGCCSAMFQHCHSLTGAEKLHFGGDPLWNDACKEMFKYCSSLVVLPDRLWSVNSQAGGTFQSMFNHCWSLTGVPSGFLPADITSMGQWCYASLFDDCRGLVYADPNMIQTTTTTSACFAYMFTRCYALTAAPILPAERTGTSGYFHMFESCSSLMNVPGISATYINGWGMNKMFNECPQLSSIRVAFTGWQNDGYERTQNWVSGVAAEGNFYCPVDLGDNESIERGLDFCPDDWTVINE